MVITSEAYKNEQKQDLREKSYVYIYMGLINQIAKDAAEITSGLTPYSNVNSAFKTNKHEDVAQYATLEENFTKVNDTNAFLPRSSTFYADNQGIVVATLNSQVRITFGSAVDIDIKGFTIDFGEEYPTAFTITNGTDTYSYTKNDFTLFSCEDQFDNCEYIDIIPTAMRGGSQRMRIISLEFGIGLSFSNEQIISTQRRNTVAHISDALPLKAFDFTISNLSRKFSQDNPLSYSNYIQQGQKVEYNYGRDIVDSEGNVSQYIIPGGKTYVKTWSSTDMQAKFSTVGKLDLMDSDYYKGSFSGDIYFTDKYGNQYISEQWTSAKEIAENVLQDAGLSSDEYFISSYLSHVRVVNPLPIATHKACLQMLANFTKSILCEDRDGRICLLSSFLPTSENITLTPTNMEFADLETFDRSSTLKNFASLEIDYTRVDDTMYFRGRTNRAKSGLVSDIGGGSVQIEYNVAWTFYGIEIEFSEHVSTSCLIEYYSDGTKLGEIDVACELVTKIQQVFESVDKVVFTFEIDDEEVNGFIDEFDNILVDENSDVIGYVNGKLQRVHVNHIKMQQESGYTIGNIDLKEFPTATSIEHIRNININYYSYVPGNDMKQITSTQVVLGVNLIKFSNPNMIRGWFGIYRFLWDDGTQDWNENTTYSTGNKVRFMGIKYQSRVSNNKGHYPQDPNYPDSYWTALDNEDVYVLEKGDYYCKINVTNIPQGTSSEPLKLLVYGYPYNVTYSTYTESLHDIGNDMKLTNVLVYDKDTKDENNHNLASNAADLCNWIEEYLENDTEYTISYRGEPVLDCDDLVYLENQFVKNNLCRIEEEEISTAIGMSLGNSMKLRRVSYDLD